MSITTFRFNEKKPARRGDLAGFLANSLGGGGSQVPLCIGTFLATLRVVTGERILFRAHLPQVVRLKTNTV